MGITHSCFVDVDETGAAEVQIILKADGPQLTLPLQCDAVRPGGQIVVVNESDLPSRVQLAYRSFASKAATASDVTAVGVFRDLFSSDVLDPDQHIEVGHTVLLFSDLVGSTEMYEKLGDTSAYALVREHFRVLDDIIAQHQGRLIKTIGDAVMVSFPTVPDALGAALAGIEGVRAIAGPDGVKAGLGLKIGIHVGACLAVTANGAGDYFGRTVNLAARVQGVAGADEIVLSTPAASAPRVDEMLGSLVDNGRSFTRESVSLKGVPGEMQVLRLRI